MRSSWFALFILGLLLLGCTQSRGPSPSATPSPIVTASPSPTSRLEATPFASPAITDSETNPEIENVGLANPASVFCQKQGYLSQPDGTCRFSDGTSCDEWAFYRGTCGAPKTDCEKAGGKINARTETVNGYTGSYAVCVFSDGSECSEPLYSSGECKAGQCKKWTAENACQTA